MARAAWHGSRIILRQVSAEMRDSPRGTRCISGVHCHVSLQLGQLLRKFIAGEGDQKFIPDLTAESLRKLAAISSETKSRLETILNPLLAVPPFALGYPGKNAQSNYYPGAGLISQEEIAKVSDMMEKHSIGPENTRIRKPAEDGNPIYHLLQASSAETEDISNTPQELARGIFLVKGGHAEELSTVCIDLERAKQYASNSNQLQVLTRYIESFRTGSMMAFQESQKAWVKDVAARVENVIGFIEPYRDPAGIRSEWEGMIGIADPGEVASLKRLVESSTAIIWQLLWALEGVNDGKGPFEKGHFEAPDFTCLHALAVCRSVVFEASNLPNYNHIRENYGFENIVFANRLAVNHNPNLPCPWVKPSELKRFKSSTHIVRFLTTAIHELLGHGSGKLLSETQPGTYNFDKQSPPISPLTREAVTSHYLPSQTWNSVFGGLAGTVEECRAILVSEYLMNNKELLEIFKYTDNSNITADDLLYVTYLNIGVDGLQALESYNAQNQAWGQAHHPAHFSILKHMLQDIVIAESRPSGVEEDKMKTKNEENVRWS
ncbi:peptidase family M49-domain-containing protein [Lasiosphaeria miniovina]|uniref:Peptidase family M49-domain-containing protein n=1 Tax=Lasiosphaeria miniovina TaxID=1954250 RepID=A0AA39ZQL3_9PEZI|nr:peptidase family M49-domain-containing protein [Lasiosphaeria miniovina]KAK0701875.1 peptidase family M49-domain-containing protein [Lasiosphaeria miniovina]